MKGGDVTEAAEGFAGGRRPIQIQKPVQSGATVPAARAHDSVHPGIVEGFGQIGGPELVRTGQMAVGFEGVSSKAHMVSGFLQKPDAALGLVAPHR
jgi:hypothetical protein